jgi:propionate CoA-transferase
VLPIAQAAHNHGGLVIAQVRRLLPEALPPQQVRVPGRLVSRIVVADEAEHWQTFGEPFNAAYCSAIPAAGLEEHEVTEEISETVRRIIAERACDELRPGNLANLGIGLPEGIAIAAAARGLLADVTLTVESGPIGGVPAGGLSFGASRYPQAIIDQPSQFDFYDGGGLDFAALGAAEADQFGNVNVSRFGSRFAGVGGFVNISQSARRLVFCGTLTADGLEAVIEGGRLVIRREGRIRKFVQQVQQVSFAGREAALANRDVLFVTERAVFRLTMDGLELIEAAPGIDIEQDIVGQMEFRPLVKSVRLMRIV